MKLVTLTQAEKGRIGGTCILNDEGFIDASRFVPNTPRRVLIRTAGGVNMVANYERGKWSVDSVLDWREDNGI